VTLRKPLIGLLGGSSEEPRRQRRDEEKALVAFMKTLRLRPLPVPKMFRNAGSYDRLPTLMADLVRHHVAVIATPSS
jgi:hypothetical protein